MVVENELFSPVALSCIENATKILNTTLELRQLE